MKYGQTHKTHIVLEYEYLRWIKILLPTTNTWLSKDMGVEMHYQPTNEAKQLEGGKIKIVAKRDNKPVMNIGGYYGPTLDSTKCEIVLVDLHMKLFGKISLDHLSMNGLMPKIAMEAKIHKDNKK